MTGGRPPSEPVTGGGRLFEPDDLTLPPACPVGGEPLAGDGEHHTVVRPSDGRPLRSERGASRT